VTIIKVTYVAGYYDEFTGTSATGTVDNPASQYNGVTTILESNVSFGGFCTVYITDGVITGVVQ
jgi:hypothetical protein